MLLKQISQTFIVKSCSHDPGWFGSMMSKSEGCVQVQPLHRRAQMDETPHASPLPTSGLGCSQGPQLWPEVLLQHSNRQAKSVLSCVCMHAQCPPVHAFHAQMRFKLKLLPVWLPAYLAHGLLRMASWHENWHVTGPQPDISAFIAGQTQWTKPGDASLAPSTSLTAPADAVAFIAADAFAGPRAGYAYKLGPQGTGYYQDQGPMPAQGTQAVLLPTCHKQYMIGPSKHMR